MAYSAEINRNDPSCFLFIIDQSGSMEETMSGGNTKALFVAEVLNKTIAEIVIRCTKADGVRDYFDIGVIAYADDDAKAGFQGKLGGNWLCPVSQIADNPLRVERKEEKLKNSAGETYEKNIVYPVWFEPECAGRTPMKKALKTACNIMVDWCDNHPNSYPPTVFHVSDGRSTDGDPEEEADILQKIHTTDGTCLLFNLHVDTGTGSEVVFPFDERSLPDDFAKMLFRISSPFPPHLSKIAGDYGYTIASNSRFFIYKAGMDFIVHFFEMGTRPANLR